MKSLVIYFSHTGENYMRNGLENIDKGNTEIVAEYIKDSWFSHIAIEVPGENTKTEWCEPVVD